MASTPTRVADKIAEWNGKIAALPEQAQRDKATKLLGEAKDLDDKIAAAA